MRVVTVLLFALMAGACGGEAVVAPVVEDGPDGSLVDGAQATGGVLRIAVAVDPISIDPREVIDDLGQVIARALFEPLVDVSASGLVVPAAAERWEVSDDGMTLTFRLRDATFHDGTPVTADAFAAALGRVADDLAPPRFRSHLLRNVVGVPTVDGAVPRGVEVLDERTLVVRLRRPQTSFLASLADLALVPLPASSDSVGFAEEPIGNGPFAMVGPRERGAFVRLRAVEDHHRAPRVDGVVVQVVAGDPSAGERWQAVLDGAVQVSDLPSGRRAEAVDALGRSGGTDLGGRVVDGAVNALSAYAFDVSRPPFDDADLRRAVAASIDRVAIAALLDGSVVPAERLLPPSSVPPGSRAPACPHCRRDVAVAREALARWRERQGDVPLPTLVLTYPRSERHAVVAERIASDVEEVLGLPVRLRSLGLEAFARTVSAGTEGAFRLGLRAAGDGVPASLLDPAVRPGAPEDWVRLALPGLVELLDRASDGGEGADQALLEVEALFLDTAAIVPLHWPRRDLVVGPGVRGLRISPAGRWWLEEAVLVDR